VSTLERGRTRGGLGSTMGLTFGQACLAERWTLGGFSTA